MKNAPHYAIGSVDHALRLATLLQVEGPLGVSEAADRIGVARSTAHRLLQMLVYRDFAVQEPDRRYAAGPVLRLGALPASSDFAALRRASLPHLRSLVNRVEESANLSVVTGAHSRFLLSVECDRPLRVSDRAGAVLPAHLTSGGQAILASLDPADVEQRYADADSVELAGGGSGGQVNVRSVRRELEAVRRLGFALNRDRTESGVTAIGKAIRWAGGSEAAVSLSLPSSRFSEADLPRYVAEVAACVHDIERDLAGQITGG